MRRAGITVCIFFSSVWLSACSQRPISLDRGQASVSSSAGNFLRVGAAAVELESDDSMVIAGGIHPVRLKGQEGQLRVVAVALETLTDKPLVIVACDVLMLTRDLLDPVVDEIESSLGIDSERILINTTHTHHAPSTVTVHGYGRDEVFCQRLQQGIIKAVRQAHGQLADAGPSRFCFRLGQEDTVGRNSRLRWFSGRRLAHRFGLALLLFGAVLLFGHSALIVHVYSPEARRRNSGSPLLRSRNRSMISSSPDTMASGSRVS